MAEEDNEADGTVVLSEWFLRQTDFKLSVRKFHRRFACVFLFDRTGAGSGRAGGDMQENGDEGGWAVGGGI